SIGGHIYDWLHHDPDLQREMEYNANHSEVHRTCDQKAPPGINPCDKAKFALNRALACKAARQAHTNRWFGGVFDQVHQDHMDQLEREIENARKKVDNACKQPCAR